MAGEFRLLVELAAAARRVVSREELLKRVWGPEAERRAPSPGAS